jgi:hypothetical protein
LPGAGGDDAQQKADILTQIGAAQGAQTAADPTANAVIARSVFEQRFKALSEELHGAP